MPKLINCPKCLAKSGKPGGDPLSAHTRGIGCELGLLTSGGEQPCLKELPKPVTC